MSHVLSHLYWFIPAFLSKVEILRLIFSFIDDRADELLTRQDRIIITSIEVLLRTTTMSFGNFPWLLWRGHNYDIQCMVERSSVFPEGFLSVVVLTILLPKKRSFPAIRTSCRRHAQRRVVAVVFVDHLQAIANTGWCVKEKEQQQFLVMRIIIIILIMGTNNNPPTVRFLIPLSLLLYRLWIGAIDKSPSQTT